MLEIAGKRSGAWRFGFVGVELTEPPPVLVLEPVEPRHPPVAAANHGGLDQQRFPSPRGAQRAVDNRPVQRSRASRRRRLGFFRRGAVSHTGRQHLVVGRDKRRGQCRLEGIGHLSQ